jgi:hypothetical protein
MMAESEGSQEAFSMRYVAIPQPGLRKEGQHSPRVFSR